MDQKKMELLERSSSVFMKYGLKSVTMDDLCREIGVSKKTIYKYFEDKNDLVLSIIQFKIEIDKQACEGCMNGAENAIDELIGISRFVIEQMGNINPSVFLDLKKHYPQAWKRMHDHKWEFVLNNIRENIIRGKEQNLYRENLNPEIISRFYVSSMDAMMDGEVYPYPEFKTDQILTEILRFHIRGLANDNGINYLKEHFNREINE
jgi:AcrR family transcriptional regulator